MIGSPRAAPPMTRNEQGVLAYHEHRTMADVMAREAVSVRWCGDCGRAVAVSTWQSCGGLCGSPAELAA